MQWRYEIQTGPNGEQDYAWVYEPGGAMVCTAKLHHAFMIVGGMNNVDFLSSQLSLANGMIDELKAETSDEFESRLDHQNPYKQGCDPALAHNPVSEGMKRTQEIMQGGVDMGRPACGQGDEWGRKPTDERYGEPKS